MSRRSRIRRQRWQLWEGDSLELLKQLPDCSIDAVVTDPPSAIGFMGLTWDSDKGGRDQWIGWLSSICSECLRVLKPGGHALVWAIPRTSHWTGTAIENAGFEVRDIITYLFGSGFPKSRDVSKDIDQSNGSPEKAQEFKKALAQKVKQSGKPRSQIDEECGFTMRYDTPYEKDPIGWGCTLPDPKTWKQVKRVLGIEGHEWDSFIQGASRKVVGKQIRKNAPNGLVTLNREPQQVTRLLTEPYTTPAQTWSGWGTALKPAVEFWILARKPLVSTIASNVLQYGTGALNIDGCRIKTLDADAKAMERCNTPGSHRMVASVSPIGTFTSSSGSGSLDTSRGRWPAHLVLSHAESVWVRLKHETPKSVVHAIHAFFCTGEGVRLLQERISRDAFRASASKILLAGMCRTQPPRGEEERMGVSGLHVVWEPVRDNPRMGSKRKKEVLLEEVSRVLLEPSTPSPTEGSTPSRLCSGQSESDVESTSRQLQQRELVSMEGGTIHRFRRLSARYGRCPSSKTEKDSGLNGLSKSEGISLHSGASSGGSSSSRTPSKKRRDCSSPQREENRQPSGKSAHSSTIRSHCSSSLGREKIPSTETRGEAPSAEGRDIDRGKLYLEIEVGLVPPGWMDYFENSSFDSCIITHRHATRAVPKRAFSFKTGEPSKGYEVIFDGEDIICADDCPVKLLDGQSGESLSTGGRIGNKIGMGAHGIYGHYKSNATKGDPGYGDAGGASRFFYCAKPDRTERDLGCSHLPTKTGGELTNREEGSAGLNNPRAGAGRVSGGKNLHPTVKAARLMRWLCRLITPPGGLVLDPFTGSGSTGIAALAEGCRFIGMEMNPEYAEVARARLSYVSEHPEVVPEP